MRFLLPFVFLVACSSGGEATSPEPGHAPAKAPGTAAPPAPAIGLDGPEALAVPTSVPKTSAELPTDAATLAKGEASFGARGCGGCHAFGSKLVGPDLVGITDRRSPTWVARMILHPEKMTAEDPVAKDLFRQTMVQMPNQNVPEDEIAPLIAYIGTKKAP